MKFRVLFIAASFLVIFLAVAAYAQESPYGVTLGVGAHFNADKLRDDSRRDRSGFNAELGGHISRLYAGARIFGDDGQSARFQVGARYGVLYSGEHKLSIGGGYWDSGRMNKSRERFDGGFGEVHYNYDDITAFLRLGNHEYVNAGAAYRIFEKAGVGVEAQYNYFHHDNRFNWRLREHQHLIGVGIVFDSRQR